MELGRKSIQMNGNLSAFANGTRDTERTDSEMHLGSGDNPGANDVILGQFFLFVLLQPSSVRG